MQQGHELGSFGRNPGVGPNNLIRVVTAGGMENGQIKNILKDY